MNGTTGIDDSLNPGSAELDRRTYGYESFNFSVYGHRLIKFTIGRLTVDLYKGIKKPFTAKGGGANGTSTYRMLFWRGGMILWITRKGITQ